MSKKQALKLSKETGIPIPKSETDFKGWIQEIKAEKKFDKVLDFFEKNAKEIMAKKNMKNVVAELKNYQRNRIEFEIPVERTDPPTVSKAVIADRLGNINIQNYTVSFSVTVIVQKLDEDGYLESEKTETTAEEPINKIKKLEKRPAGALAGFLNTYMKKLVKSLTYVQKVNLILVKRVRNRKALTPNFDGMKTNCIIEIVQRLTQKRKDYQKKIKPKLDALNEKYFEQGAAEQAIDEICRAAQVNIHVVSILQETWYHMHLGDNKLTILICSHNGHATYLDEYKDMTDFLEPEKTKKVEYLEGGLTEHFLKNESPIKFPIVIKDQIVAYFTQSGELYKNRDIFFDGDDWEKNKNNDKLKNVFTLTSRYYKELKDKYDLQDKYRNEDLYYFVRCADLYTPPWCTDPDYAEIGQAFDQNRAYMFYQKSPYYKHYQFPRMPTHFYKTENISQEIFQKLLKVTGFAQVKNVEIPGDGKAMAFPNLEYIRKTQMIQDNCIYTTMRLNWLFELGVTFDITRVAFANDKQEIDFRIQLTEWQENAGFSSKQEECALMGRLIPNQHRQHTSLVHCKDENEFLQLRYQLGSRVLNVDFDRKIIYYTTESISKLKGAVHVHAYILDYQQIEFATKAMSVPFHHILKVKVDCLVLAKPSLETKAKDLHIKCKGKWSLAAIIEFMEMMPEINFTEIKAFEGWTDANIKALDAPQKWAGFHEEREIKDCKTAHIDTVDFTHRKYIRIPTLSELPEVALHRFNEITGSAGCAKTYTATHFNLWDVCMLVPTNALRVKFRDENPDMPCQTFHKAFNMNMKKGDYMPDRRQYSNYILDECSMICKGMFNQMLTDKNAKNANLIIIHDQAQLAAVMPDNSRWEDPKTRYFTYGKEYKARQWNKIHLTEQKRQNDPRFIHTLDRMRELQDKSCSLLTMVNLLEDRIITEQQALELYRMDTKDIVIASTNEEVDRWNQMLLKQAKPNELKLKYTTTKGKHVNNERVIMQTNQLACQELAFASTVHIVQGITFTDRLFISLSLLKKGNNFDPHLLYTAVSRVKSIENLYLVQI